MKKILSVILIIVFTLSGSVLSLASGEVITQDSQGNSSNITVDYNAGVTYTVTIPASVAFSDAEKEVERSLQVSNVVLTEGSTLSVDLTSLNHFKMMNGEGYIEYDLFVNAHDLAKENNATILTVSAGENSGWVILDFVTALQKDHALYAGNYTDTLTFTVGLH